MIVFTDKHSYSNAVWEAMAKHISYMAEDKIVLLVDERCFPDLRIPSNTEIKLYRSSLHAIKLMSKSKKIYFLNVLDLFKFSFFRLMAKKLFVWHQGIIPEESYSRNKSNLRYYLLSFIEYFSLSVAEGVILVSKEAKVFMERKYKYLKLKKYIVVPCLSDFKLNTQLGERENKFVYIGGISSWQCFDDVITTYLYLKSVIKDASLSIITLETERALDIIHNFTPNLKEHQIVVKSLYSRQEIELALNDHKYGFLLREDIPLNNVAAPIKFGEYLSCGVAPILTEAVVDYAKIAKNEGIGIIKGKDMEVLAMDIRLFNKTPSDIYQCYLSYFDEKDIQEKYKWLLK